MLKLISCSSCRWFIHVWAGDAAQSLFGLWRMFIRVSAVNYVHQRLNNLNKCDWSKADLSNSFFTQDCSESDQILYSAVPISSRVNQSNKRWLVKHQITWHNADKNRILHNKWEFIDDFWGRYQSTHCIIANHINYFHTIISSIPLLLLSTSFDLSLIHPFQGRHLCLITYTPLPERRALASQDQRAEIRPLPLSVPGVCASPRLWWGRDTPGTTASDKQCTCRGEAFIIGHLRLSSMR